MLTTWEKSFWTKWTSLLVPQSLFLPDIYSLISLIILHSLLFINHVSFKVQPSPFPSARRIFWFLFASTASFCAFACVSGSCLRILYVSAHIWLSSWAGIVGPRALVRFLPAMSQCATGRSRWPPSYRKFQMGPFVVRVDDLIIYVLLELIRFIRIKNTHDDASHWPRWHPLLWTISGFVCWYYLLAFRPDHPASFNQNHADDQEVCLMSCFDWPIKYQRLRALGRKEAEARGKCFNDAHRAYEEGNGALAHRIHFSEGVVSLGRIEWAGKVARQRG